MASHRAVLSEGWQQVTLSSSDIGRHLGEGAPKAGSIRKLPLPLMYYVRDRGHHHR